MELAPGYGEAVVAGGIEEGLDNGKGQVEEQSYRRHDNEDLICCTPADHIRQG